ncbi:alpha/beta hydrolase [bacterium]|jgi:acetyl esterase/lipase|nr:alpha/beta hydrolase [Verrucomicrobiales bacterium]MDC0251768.1 alpha/beta hydrolase [bacterium]MDF1852920.1 alpha/beta hydrolase [Verrucomicrobiales bacterium]
MLNFHRAHIVIISLSMLVVNAEDGYQDTLRETESFTRFRATEKAAIVPEKRDAYQHWIAGYFETLDGKTGIQHPGASLEGLMKGVTENGFLKSSNWEESFENAAWLAGMELIEDRRCFEPDLSSVEVKKGMIYATRNGYPLRCDLYLPKVFTGKIPVILCIHGGGFRVHRRAWFGGYAGYFASQGYAAVTIDYRKRPGIQSDLEPVQDAKAAVRWIRYLAATYGLNPEKIGAVGGSAGAYLTAVLATTGNESSLEGPEKGAAPLTVSSEIQAATTFAPGVRNLQLEEVPQEEIDKFPSGLDLRLLSPYWSADRDSAPILLVHATNDKVNDAQNSKDLHAKYREHGAKSELKLVEGEGHVFYTKEKWAETAMAFFKSVFGD